LFLLTRFNRELGFIEMRLGQSIPTKYKSEQLYEHANKSSA